MHKVRELVQNVLLVATILTCQQAFAAESADSPAYIWWEAENYTAASPISRETHEILSGGQWIHLETVNPDQPRFLEYANITVPASGLYHFYVRKFYRHGPYVWNFDGNEPEGSITRELALIDSAELRTNTEANWTYAGEIHLTAGNHHLRLDMMETTGAAAFDAFVLTQSPFPFRGKYQPEEIIEANEPGWFAWQYAPDDYADSPIDLSFLNDDVAGEKGFIQARGENFVYADTGETVRFWGVNAGEDVLGLDTLTLQTYARDLAKYGVNLVRVHTPLYDGRGPDFDTLISSRLDNLQRFISVMKAEGIYVSLSVYFPLWLRLGPDDPRFPGYTDSSPFGAIFYDPALQEIYRQWWQVLLNRDNPYTGIPLKDEAALFSLELVNEDSLLFWTLSERNIPPQSMNLLETQFADWLDASYGSLQAASESWSRFWGLLGGFDEDTDKPDEGRIGIMPIYDIAQGESQRAMDTARFLSEKQQEFFTRHYAYLKDEIGFGGMVSASNWITANDSRLGPLDKYSNTVGDFMDQHGYYEPFHDSADGTSSYSIRAGHVYRDNSALKFLAPESDEEHSFRNPLMNIIYQGKPSVISEVNWPMPNRYRADMPFLISSFGRLQGLDAIIHFTSGPRPWDLQLGKFSLNSPVIKGQWPAAALAFRMGYVEEGPMVVELNLPPEQHLFELSGSPLSLSPNPDLLRNTGSNNVQASAIHPLATLTGRTRINFDDTEPFTERYEFEPYLDQGEETITAAGNQLFWDYASGYVSANSPKFQGVSGYLADAGPLEFDDVEIISSMEYGSIWVLSLDNLPLPDSTRLLVAVMSEEKMSGWQTVRDRSGKSTITSMGHAPVLVRNFNGTVRFKQDQTAGIMIIALDQNGYISAEHSQGPVLELDPTISYYLIQKPE